MTKSTWSKKRPDSRYFSYDRPRNSQPGRPKKRIQSVHIQREDDLLKESAGEEILEEAVTKEETLEAAPLESAAAEEAVAKEETLEAALLESAAAEAAAKETVVETMSAEKAATEEAFMEEEFTEEKTLAEKASLERAPVKSAVLKEAPVKVTPLKEITVEAAPVKELFWDDDALEEVSLEDDFLLEDSRKETNRSEIRRRDNRQEERAQRERIQKERAHRVQRQAERHQAEQRKSNVKTDIQSTGRFGLGHKKTKRAAILYILEDIGDAFVRAKNWCVKNYRTSIPGAICIVLVIVVACILIRNAQVDRANRADMTQTHTSDEAEAAVTEQPLEENAYEYINQFVEKYYTASAEGDLDTYISMRSYTDETERIRMQKKADYIDSYKIISCYTKAGPVDNSYLVYVYYEVKFVGIDTAAPGLNTLYLCTNDSGELYVFSGEVDENVTEYMKAASTQEDVKDLFTKADVTYSDVVNSDEELKTFLEHLSENLQNDVTLAMNEIRQEEEPEVPEEPVVTPEPEAEPEPEQPQADTVITTDKVNVRSSSSAEATKLGTVDAGTQLTRYESLENGWSRVVFEGAEAYIKTEFLQAVETTNGTVVTTDTVNIRASASESATKLGTVNAGTTLDLIEHQENGWSRILYNGMTAYVKTEFVQ